jgi:hypothetical protein
MRLSKETKQAIYEAYVGGGEGHGNRNEIRNLFDIHLPNRKIDGRTAEVQDRTEEKDNVNGDN